MFIATLQPLSLKTVTAESKADFKDLVAQNRPPFWRRLLIGLAFLTLGVSAVSVGATSIFYQLTHMNVRGGLVNGRTVRIQAPVDGTIQDFMLDRARMCGQGRCSLLFSRYR